MKTTRRKVRVSRKFYHELWDVLKADERWIGGESIGGGLVLWTLDLNGESKQLQFLPYKTKAAARRHSMEKTR